jgi:virulence factor Mce-like protein
MTPRARRSGAGRRRASSLRLTLAGLLGLAAIWGLMYVAVTAQNGLPFRRYHVMYANFARAGDLQTYDDVRIAGERIGQVSGISFTNHIVHVKLQLDTNAPRLRDGTTAQIRLNGLIGAEYVQLTPSANGRYLPAGATIPASVTSTTSDLFDAMSTLDQPRRQDLRTIIRGFGEGFLSRGYDINQALADSPPLMRDADAFLQTLNAEPAALRRLFPSFDALSRQVYPARYDIALGFDPEARAAYPFAARAGDVQQMLQRAPATLRAASTQLPLIDNLLSATGGLAQATARLTVPAPGALRAATGLLQHAPGPLRSSFRLLSATQHAIPVTLALTAAIAPLSPPLARLFSNVLPILSVAGATVCDFKNAFAWLHSASGFGVPPNGPIGPFGYLRILVGGNAETNTGQGPAPSSQIKVDTTPAPCIAAAEKVPGS